jgi:hypothetical protein
MSGTTRTTPTDAATRWDSTPTSVTRGVSPGVAERRARALRGSGKGSAPKPRTPKASEPSEMVANFFGLLWIAFGALIVVISLVFVAGSMLMFGVLREISSARNFDDAVGRTSEYEDFFKEVAAAGFQVDGDRPNIKEGVTQYLWTVHPPNDGPLRVFSWQHFLESNEMRPTSNSAALLDIELGNLTEAEALAFSRQDTPDGGSRETFHLDTADPISNAIIDRNASYFAKNSGNGWSESQVVADNAPPLPPPLIDPKSRSRKGVGSAVTSDEEDEEVASTEDPTAGEDGDKSGEDVQPPEEKQPDDPAPEPPIVVEPQPPADDGGGGTDPEPEPEPEPADPGDGDATPVG